MKITLRKGQFEQPTYEHGVIYDARGNTAGRVTITLPDGRTKSEDNKTVQMRFVELPEEPASA